MIVGIANELNIVPRSGTPIERLDEAQARDLNQILARSLARRKAPRERFRQRHELLDQRRAFTGIPASSRARNAKLAAALSSAATRLAETNDRIHDKHS
jgi:hypothetical protein